MLVAGVCLALLGWATPLLPQGRPSECEAERGQWLNAVALLRTGMEAYRSARDESVGPRIEQDVAAGKGTVPVARTVRAVLQERRRKMAETEDICLRQTERERFAFEQWHRCSARGARRGGPAAGELREASADRDRLRKDLSDLLLDEAYAQYKNARPQTESYAESEQQRPMNAGYQSDRGAGYGRTGYPAPGGTYQGYYR